jgi:cytochrome c biogenesis protein CcmG/thiol:disulfide interchange protein DsbE
MRWAAALAPIAVLLVLVVMFAGWSLRRDPRVTPMALVGRPTPDVALPPLAGGAPTPLRPLARGPKLVVFFASWCAPCVEEAAALMALKAEGVPMIGIAYKDEPQNSAAFLAKFGDPFETVLVDRDGRAGIEFGVTGVPETYAIDAAGVIKAKKAVALTADDAESLMQTASR